MFIGGVLKACVNEKLLISEHIDMTRFYYDFIRNFDQADL